MTAKYKTPFLVLAALFVIWGIFGFFDLPNTPYSGYITDPSNTVTQIEVGSPAEQAGLNVGDRIVSIEGVEMEDTRALANMPRALIGETRSLVVETAGAAGEEGPATREVAITYSGQSGKYVALTLIAAFIGLCFLVFGLLSYMKAPSRASTFFALTGLGFGVALLPGPYFASFAARQISGFVFIIIITLAFAFLLHCMLEFPKPKAILDKKHMTKLLYVGPAILALFVLYLIIFMPRSTGGLNRFASILFGLFVVAYFGLAAVAMIHSYVKASPEERSSYGLNFVLLAILIGLLPMVIQALVGMLAPRVVLPGADYFFVTFVLIPIAISLAIMKREAAAAPAARPTPVM